MAAIDRDSTAHTATTAVGNAAEATGETASPLQNRRIVSRAVEPEEDEDQGWSEMAKKRSERKWKWGRSKKEQPKEEPLGDLYQNVE